MTQWRPVIGWEQFYEVSDEGDVRRLGKLKAKALARHPKTGHLHTCLNRPGVQVTAKVHRLVLEAFVGPCPTGMETRHRNGDPADNRLGNLSWSTHAENMGDLVEHGTARGARVVECPQGHPYDEANTYVYDGRRFCRACQRAAGARYRARRRRPQG